MLEICLCITLPHDTFSDLRGEPERWLLDTMDNRRQLIEQRDAVNRTRGTRRAYIAERPLGWVRPPHVGQDARDVPPARHRDLAASP